MAIEAGLAEFAVLDYQGVVCLLSRFGDGVIPWNCSTFSYHLVSEESRWLPPEPQPGEAALLWAHLVDASNNNLAAQRALSFSTKCTSVLHRLIREQAARAFDRAEHWRICREMEKQFHSWER